MAIYLFHSSLSPVTISRGIQYDEALQLSNQGHTVYFAYCDGLMTQCFNNIIGDKAECYICKSYFKEEKRKFGKHIYFIQLSKLIDKETTTNIKNYKLNYETIKDIKNLEYKNINIGQGALSGYISKSRNLMPLIDDCFKYFFDQNLYNAILTIEAFRKAVQLYHPDHIVLYNGRFADSRPIWQIALKYHIQFTTIEAIYGIEKIYKSKFENSTPHSIDKNIELINHYWNNSKLDYNSKCKIGSSFFERRRTGLYTGDKIYTINQIKNFLPENWDSSKKNIVIFNSSEDEYAVMGDEYEKHNLFNSQLLGLQFIKEQLQQNINVNVTLRIHPNLSKVNYSYARDLLKLRSGNFFVIDADSKISSYALIDNADIVLVHSSTIGIEAVYWNKPTIVFGGSIYNKMGCFYIPNSTDDFIKLLNSELKPKDRIQAIKYGYYLLNEEWDGPSVIDYMWSLKSIKFLNFKKQIGVCNWKMIMNSRLLYRIYDYIKRLIIKKYYSLYRNKGIRFDLPINEDKRT